MVSNANLNNLQRANISRSISAKLKDILQEAIKQREENGEIVTISLTTVSGENDNDNTSIEKEIKVGNLDITEKYNKLSSAVDHWPFNSPEELCIAIVDATTKKSEDDPSETLRKTISESLKENKLTFKNGHGINEKTQIKPILENNNPETNNNNAKNANLKNVIEKLKEELDQQKKQNKDLQDQLEEKINEKNSVIEDLEAERDTIEKKYDQETSKSREKRKELAVENKQLKDKLKEIESKERTIKELRNRIASLESENKKLKRKLKNLKNKGGENELQDKNIEETNEVRQIARELKECFIDRTGLKYTEITNKYNTEFPDKQAALTIILNTTGSKEERIEQIEDWVKEWYQNDNQVKQIDSRNLSPMGI